MRLTRRRTCPQRADRSHQFTALRGDALRRQRARRRRSARTANPGRWRVSRAIRSPVTRPFWAMGSVRGFRRMQGAPACCAGGRFAYAAHGCRRRCFLPGRRPQTRRRRRTWPAALSDRMRDGAAGRRQARACRSPPVAASRARRTAAGADALLMQRARQAPRPPRSKAPRRGPRGREAVPIARRRFG